MGIKPAAKRVGILGAGAAGLCAARHSLDAGHEVTVFEQQHDVGGTWLYNPEPNSFSSLYEKMNTNIPKEVMSFQHLPLVTSGPESFVRHQEILAYLQRYAEPVRHLIKFNSAVVRVHREGEEWKVTVKPTKVTPLATGDENSNGALINGHHAARTETHSFDVLFVCNGHFSQPRLPQCAQKLKLPWIHCHNYRRPHVYAGQEVAVVGAGPSGVDLAIQLSKHAKRVHMLYNQKMKFGVPANVVDNARLVDVDEDGRTLLLQNGTRLAGIDAVIFCTGYVYEVPFCDKGLIQPKADGQYLAPLYLHFIHTQYPTSLYFIGLNWNLIPFVCFDYQILYALALVDGRAPVPDRDEMERFEEDRLRELEKENLPARFYHNMGEAQWAYFDLLAKLSGHRPLPPVIRQIYDHVHDQRLENLATYKSFRYRVLGPDLFEHLPCVDLDCN